MDQRDMAQVIKASRQSYNALECGRRSVTLEELQDICAALKLKLLIVPEEFVI